MGDLQAVAGWSEALVTTQACDWGTVPSALGSAASR